MNKDGKVKNRRLLLLGSGGHCNSVMDSVLSSELFDEIGLVEKDGTAIDSDIRIVGTDSELEKLFDNGWNEAFITVGSIGNTAIREKLYELVRKIGFGMPVIADPTSIISNNAIIEEGTYIGKRVVINSGCKVGKCAIINSGAVIDHDCEIGDFCHISPGTVMCGEVTVQNFSHIGAGSVLKQGVTIGQRSLIGIGSVVVKDISGYVIAYGNPCRIRKRI